MTGTLKGVGAAIAAYFAADKIAGFFGSAIDEASALQAQFNELQAVSGATADEIAQLKARADELGLDDTLAVSALDAAKGMTELARAGFSAQEQLEAIRPAIALAQGDGMDLAQAAGIITSNLAGFSLQAEESGRVADVLSKAAASAKTTVDQLASALSYAAPAANAAGYSLEQTTAIIAKMQNAGIDGTRAGTALASIFTDLLNPASKASKALDAAGISTRHFVDLLAVLERGGPQAEAAILAFGKEAGPALRALLAQGSGGLRDLIGELDSAGGHADQTAGQMNRGLAKAMEVLGDAWGELKKRLVEPLLQPIEAQARSLAAAIVHFAETPAFAKIRDGLVSTFHAAAAALREFAASIDWQALAGQIEAFFEATQKRLDDFATNAQRVGQTAQVAFSLVSLSVRILGAAIHGFVGGVTGALGFLSARWADLFGLLSKGTVGGVRRYLEGVARGWDELAARLGKYSTQALAEGPEALKGLKENAARLGDAWAKLNAPLGKGAEGIERAGAAAEQAAGKVGLSADELDALGEGANYAAQGQQALADAQRKASGPGRALTAEADAQRNAMAANKQAVEGATDVWVYRDGVLRRVYDAEQLVAEGASKVAEAERRRAESSREAATEAEAAAEAQEGLAGSDTVSRHTIETNADAARQAIDSLNGRNTQSVHTIVVREVQGNHAGGPVPGPVQGLAEGGEVFTPPAWRTVPGSGNRDTVPAALPRGSWVLRKAAAYKYRDALSGRVPVMLTPGERWFSPEEVAHLGGTTVMRALNNLRVPPSEAAELLSARPLRRASGGPVGSAAAGAATPHGEEVTIHIVSAERSATVRGARAEALAMKRILEDLGRGL
nr:phage tail tape measure protein [Thiococcus pfennigii]